MTATIQYEGKLRCNAQHLQSNTTIETDAPTDNRGKANAFLQQTLYALPLQPAWLLPWLLKPVT
jgi:hypothetical protein